MSGMDLNQTPKSKVAVNKALAVLGIAERLTRGNGYWYFDGGQSSAWYSSSVPVYRINSGNIGWWLTQWLLLASYDSDVTFSFRGNNLQASNIYGRFLGTSADRKLSIEFNDVVMAIKWFQAYTNYTKGGK